MTTLRTLRLAAALTVAVAVVGAVTAIPTVARSAPQKGGSAPRVSTTRGRLDALAENFTLTKDQKNKIKVILDEAHKGAVPVRDALTKTHADIAAAIQANKGQAEIDAAVKAYAEQATAMMALEMKALAKVMKELTEEQRGNGAAVSAAFFAMRSAFLDPKRWDDIPSGKNY